MTELEVMKAAITGGQIRHSIKGGVYTIIGPVKVQKDGVWRNGISYTDDSHVYVRTADDCKNIHPIDVSQGKTSQTIYLIKSNSYGIFIGFKSDDDMPLFSETENYGIEAAVTYQSADEAINCAKNELEFTEKEFSVIPVDVANDEKVTPSLLMEKGVLDRNSEWPHLINGANNICNMLAGIFGIDESDDAADDHDYIEQWHPVPHKKTYCQ